jgi:hypothetical protein
MSLKPGWAGGSSRPIPNRFSQKSFDHPFAARHDWRMTEARMTLTRPLAFAGAFPFVFAALLIFSGQKTLPVIGNVQNLATSYALLILAFMAGAHWGQYLSGAKTSLNLFLLSNALTLAGWFAYLLLSPQLFFAVTGGFLRRCS